VKNRKELLFFYKNPEDESISRILATKINLPFRGQWESGKSDSNKPMNGYAFIYSKEGSYIQPILNRKVKPFLCDFNHMESKLVRTNLSRSFKGLAKSSQVLDATGGLGKDSLEMAMYFEEVIVAEKVPWLHLLLSEGLSKQLKKDFTLTNKIKLFLINSEELLKKKSFDLIYLDPMFGLLNKRSDSKKGIQLLKDCVPEEPVTTLFDLALNSARDRVVVKRHRKSEYISKTKPNYSIKSKLIRFDVYKP